MECPCPIPAALTAIPVSTCLIRFDQILKLGAQRNGYTFANETAIKTLATWTGLKAAADDTKVVTTPIIYNLIIPQSEAQTEGGNDNTTPYGLPIYKGEGFVNVTAELRGLSEAQYVALDKLSCESAPSLGAAALVLYLFNRNGSVIHKNLSGFPAYNFRISSPGSDGFNADTKYAIGWTMTSDWAKSFAISIPTDFDAVRDL